MSEDVKADKLAKVFLKIHRAREELVNKFKEEDKVLEDKQKDIEDAMLAIFAENNATTMKTAYGTLIKSTRTRYWTNDWATMYGIIKEYDCPELLERRLMQANIKQFLEDHEGVDIAGLQADTKYTVVVRKPKGAS